MANTYYDSDLTGEQIEQALEAIDGVIVPANNGKVLAINNGKIEARSVQWDADLGPKSITENGTYNPASDNLDGYSQVTVNVSGGGGTTDANHVTYDSSETYDSGTVGAALNEQRNTLTQLGNDVDDLEENLTTITRTGSTNTGSDIANGTFFYLNGVLVQAKSSIANGATFTQGTNYEVVTANTLNGALNALNDQKLSTVGLWWTRTNWMTAAEQGFLTASYDANTITINFATADKTHAENDVIFTIPAEFRPKVNITFLIYLGTTELNMIQINKDTGEAKLWVSTSRSGALRGTVTYLYNVK